MRSRRPKKKAARTATKPPRAAVKSGGRSDRAVHLRTRASEHDEVLAHQAATAEILRAITESPGEAEPTLRKIAETTARLFGAPGVSLRIVDGDEFGLYIGVGRGAEEVTRAIYQQQRTRMKVSARTLPATVVRENRQVHLPDLDHLPPEIADWPGPPVARKAGIRTMVGAPLRNQGRAIGALMVYRDKLKPFTEREQEILQSFADQAAIAIENARLLTELRGSLDRQTATTDILRVIASTPGDAEKTLHKIADTTLRLFKATGVSFSIAEGDEYTLAIGVGRGAAEVTNALQAPTAPRRPVQPRTLPGTVIRDNRQIHLADLDNLPPEMADWPGPPILRAAGTRTLVGTPLRRRDRAIGVLTVYRAELRPFASDELDLLQSFADQAAIAIENTRLLNEIRSARDAAEKTLADLKTAQASLVHAEKMASLGQLTAGIAHEIKNPLNFVNNFAGLSVDLLDELKAATARAVTALDPGTSGEIDETIEMLTGNLRKIAEHGRRADGIVKSMLAHSRGTTGERQKSDINALVEEALNLAYHGARAQDQDFNITLERDYTPAMGAIEVVPQEVTRVFLNLIGNGFHAARQRQKQANAAQFRPVLKVSTRDLGEAVQVLVRDNGTGIRPEHRDKLFQPFFTTKPTGEGTGLGLSISYEIITQQHGGTITVDSEAGSFTEFTIRLPRRGQGKSAGKVA